MKLIKKIMMLCLAFALVLSLNVVASAKDIEVEINEKQLNFDVPPSIISGRTMIPLRFTLEELGATVDWNNKTKVATARTDAYTLTVTLNSKTVVKTINETGEKQNVQMDVAPIVTNGRTLVPVRYMAELLGKAVIWDGTNRKVIIIDTDYILNNIKIKATNLYEYINKIINGELKQDANGGEYSFDFDITYKDPEGKSYNFKFKCDMNWMFDGSNIEFHLNIDPTSFKTTLQTLLNLLGESESTFNIDPKDLKLDFYCDGEKMFFTSPLLKNEAVLDELGFKDEIAGGLLIELSEDEKQEAKEMFQALEEGSFDKIRLFLDEALASITSVDDLQDLDTVIDIICEVFNNQNFTKTSDGYKFSFNQISGLKDNLERFSDQDVEWFFETFKKVAINTNIKISGNEIVDDKGTIEVEFNDPDLGLSISTNVSTRQFKDSSFKFKMPDLTNAFNYNDYMNSQQY